MKNLLALLLLFVCILTPRAIYAAEVLQIRSSTLLELGDNNRTYTVRIACLEVDPSSEDAAIKLLKKILPRRKKVNLKPQGSIDGVLLARVIPIGEENDLSKDLEFNGLGRQTC